MLSVLLHFQRAAKQRRVRHSKHCLLRVEQLESRDLLSVFTPTQIRHAYGIDQIAGDGSGQTIAIVDAYDDPSVATDFAQFNTTYGVSGSGQLTKVNQSGSTTGPFPSYNTGWAQEIALDVEWAHAVAPGANILLMEANSNSFSDLFAAVNTAKNTPGVVAVSMSWGSNEFSGESSYDSIFTSSTGHPVAFIASSGDSGAVTSYPAVSPSVLGVGGTTLTTTDSSGTYGSEKAWNGSGGGISKYESRPGYQSGITGINGNKRLSPDVAYDADPNSGVYVIFKGSTYIFGGTSVAAPQWAGLVAIADQGRGASTQNPANALDGSNQLMPSLYSSLATDLNDVTTGSTRSGRTTYSAGVGYDLVTGLGTPAANLLIPGLVGVTATANSQTSGGGSGGAAHTQFNTGLGEGSSGAAGLGSQLATPTAIVLELVNPAPAPVAPLASPGISERLSDILFASSNTDTQAGLRLLAGEELNALPTVLLPATFQEQAPTATSLLSSLGKAGSANGFVQGDDDPAMPEEGQSSSGDQLVDLAIVASGDWIS